MSIGRVYIVGAGPGAPELISLRGFRALLAADAVLIDRLLSPRFLDDLGLASTGRTVHWLGQDPLRMSQSEINEWLVSQARSGRIVVRLKGGDPFVFARGEEEAAALSAAGIPWEIIPGASAATAVPTASGYPLTRHGRGRSFAVATARIIGGDLPNAFPQADSLVIMMGTASLELVTNRLLAEGWSPRTPAAAIESGTAAWERRVEGQLTDIHEKARQGGLAAPATLVLGEAASTRREYRQRPTVLFTGLDPTGFHWLGHLLHWPATQLIDNEPGQRELLAALPRLAARGYEWLVLTDKQAVHSLMANLYNQGWDTRKLSSTRIAALDSVASRLKEFGLLADTTGNASSLVHCMSLEPGQSVLVLQGTHVPQPLGAALAASEARATAVQLYRLLPHAELGRPLPNYDVIYFVSPSAVRAYHQTYGLAAFHRQVWCIGEQTQQVLRQIGVESLIVARPEDIPRLSSTTI
ncbi:MAG: uroporphyrinogen-III C-methyltransferase [Thermoguttaceae bacterium]